MKQRENKIPLNLFHFLEGLDEDLKRALLLQLKIIWTYTSNSIEGNTFSLEETQFVIEEGLTITGKSLKEHEEIIGHARAIEILYRLIEQNTISKEDLFILHKSIQTEMIVDVYNPIGQWKNEINGRNILIKNQIQYIEYPHPDSIEHLMQLWLHFFNSLPVIKDLESLIEQYASLHISFVSIHPFFDGNGRIARLIANLPLLRAGFPPITISKEHRKTYIDLLKQYSLITPELNLKSEHVLEKSNEVFKKFVVFCKDEYHTIQDQIQTMFKTQQERNKKSSNLNGENKTK